MRFKIFAAAALFILLSASCRAGEVRVGLFCREPLSSVRVSGPCAVYSNSEMRRVPAGASLLVRPSGEGVRLSEALSFSARTVEVRSPAGGSVTLTLPDGRVFRYRGRLSVRARNGRLFVVNTLGVEEYLSSVLPGEMPCTWPQEALRAQAVVARSFALSQINRHRQEGFDLCDLTHCQVYRGAAWERPQTTRAVLATRGEVLAFGGRCIPAPFCSTCGGCTTDSFDSRTPFLSPVKDPFCRTSGHFNWSARLSPAEVEGILREISPSFRGRVKGIRVLCRDASGRAERLRFEGTDLPPVPAPRFMMACGRVAGWDKVKSTLFTVKSSGGTFELNGRGLGHGMGLCQWGARGMAEKGFTYRRILSCYFPRCEVAVKR